MSLSTATTLGLSLRAARRLRWTSTSIRRVSTGVPSPAVTARKANAEPQTQTKPQGHKGKSTSARDIDQAAMVRNIETAQVAFQDDPYHDIWAQNVPVMDLELPYRTAIWSGSQYSSLGERIKQIITNRKNWLKNSFSKAMMWTNNSFPGLDLWDLGGIKYWIYTLPLEVIRSTRSTYWLEGLRKEAFESYCQVQKAIARNDSGLVEVYATAKTPYHNDIKRVMTKSRAADCAYVWNMHAPPNPKHAHTTILSIRASPTHLGPREPPEGRLTVQALVKVQTYQSLEIYDKHAKPLHEAAENTPPVLTTSYSASNQRFIKRRISAPVNEVTEYLVFEKKMYMPTMKWTIRERLYPAEDRAPV